MKQYIFVIIILFKCFNLLATHQIPDYLIVGTDTMQIYSNPLESYFDTHTRPKILEDSWCSTACWRGYKAYFKIENDSLFLVGLYDCCEKNKSIDISQIFIDRNINNPIFADWVSDTLMSPTGELLNYIHMGYGSSYEKETDYFFKNGVFKGKKEYINSTVESEFKNLDSLRNFFQERIDWSNVPKLDSLLRVYVSIKADRQGKIIDKSVRKSGNVFCNYEALRLVDLIKAMPVIIRRNEILYSGWTLVVVFDPKQRK